MSKENINFNRGMSCLFMLFSAVPILATKEILQNRIFLYYLVIMWFSLFSHLQEAASVVSTVSIVRTDETDSRRVVTGQREVSIEI